MAKESPMQSIWGIPRLNADVLKSSSLREIDANAKVRAHWRNVTRQQTSAPIIAEELGVALLISGSNPQERLPAPEA